MSIVLERWQAWLLAGSIACAGLTVAIGAFLGGYVLGDQPAPPPPTELAEKTYTVEDLESALTACKIEGVTVESSSVTLLGADWPSPQRQCFVMTMGATPLAKAEYAGIYINEDDPPRGGEHVWSNVTLSWEQTGQGRDVTISVTR